MKRLVGIYRERENSPGRHESNDALLLEQIAERLRGDGFAVDLMSLPESDGNGAPNDTALVFSMCQGRDALLRLAEWERDGTSIMNRPSAALNTHRDHLPAILERAGVRFPRTHLFDTAKGVNGVVAEAGSSRHNGHGLWLKRGDVHASISSDVQWIASGENVENAIAQFRERGITRAALQSHCAGDEIKFYGVGDSFFFHWFFSRKENGYGVDEKALADLARRAARAAGLTIFGGDVIVDAQGKLTLIDLNDWPSFAPCREAASEAIAEIIRRRIHAG
jgi:hypothetical protein